MFLGKIKNCCKYIFRERLRRMKANKAKKLLILLMISLFFGIIATHYLENVQTRLLVSLRNKVLYNDTDSIIYEENQVFPKTRYIFTDELQINPVSVAQSVKLYADYILDLNEKGKNHFVQDIDEDTVSRIVQVADFFIEYAEKKQYGSLEYWLYPYKFDYPSYDEVMKAPWYSGMAQGQIIETLLASHVLTGDKSYLNAAQMSANAFYVPIEEGGVSIYLPEKDSGIWFEEYASKNTSHPMVLNGHNFALLGLGRLIYFDDTYRFIYEQGIKALEHCLPDFDVGVWSRYDLVKYMANPKYHQIHIEQLKKLGEQNNNDLFLNYARKFTIQKYIPLGTVYRLFFYPHNSLIAVFFINSMLFFCLCLFFVYIKELEQLN